MRLRDLYTNPLLQSYADRTMEYLFSSEMKHRMWRKLWVALAAAEHELGLPVSSCQVRELQERQNDVSLTRVQELQKNGMDEVSAHARAYGEQCPEAASIIQRGFSDCFILENTYTLLLDKAFRLVEEKIHALVALLSDVASDYADVLTWAFAVKPARKPTTLGYRAVQWIQSFLLDLSQARNVHAKLAWGWDDTSGLVWSEHAELTGGQNNMTQYVVERAARRMGLFNADTGVTIKVSCLKIDSSAISALLDVVQSCSQLVSDAQTFKATLPGITGGPPSGAFPSIGRMDTVAEYVMGTVYGSSLASSFAMSESRADDAKLDCPAIAQAFIDVAAILNMSIDIATTFEVDLSHDNEQDVFGLSSSALRSILGAQARGDRASDVLKSKLDRYIEDARSLGISRTLAERIAEDESLGMGMDAAEVLEMLTNCSRLAITLAQQVRANLRHTVVSELARLRSPMGQRQ